MLILDHLLISNDPKDGTVAGGIFTPADPNVAGSVPTLTLHTPGGFIEVKDDGALLLFDYYLSASWSKKLTQSEYMMVSREAVTTLHRFFTEDQLDQHAENACKRIVEILAARL